MAYQSRPARQSNPPQARPQSAAGAGRQSGSRFQPRTARPCPSLRHLNKERERTPGSKAAVWHHHHYRHSARRGALHCTVLTKKMPSVQLSSAQLSCVCACSTHLAGVGVEVAVERLV
ncbi:uncharacterized protein K452DRAFT_1745 [Aplosporella prunicola CBS 121167]|uniref:Uncharacterized protein n=1 Tax=Aplosporella prunicola CBS 121167 TaxID=1176127 RepID=A0A6A6BV01_9PEZI|nr:uncharacterized protein K452DRAFT_1745 [Aplosporella prunicola CBS 121167]KAF2147105.1 hypothetical protein K452DRAFT_1745 [Aplosporella prunicola CBS 121167]